MKRLGNLYPKVCSIDNLRLADQKARKGKSRQPGIRIFDRNSETNLLLLNEALLNRSYRTSKYSTFKVFEPKERLVYRLPYYPDRITHHAIMNVLEKMFVNNFTADTYSCIKKRGIHGASFALREALKDKANTLFCLKLDIRKFYPKVDHEILKALLRRKIKDRDLLWLLDEIIDSADGLPIGNYLSQYLANFYLSGLDHWLKETKRVRYYFRYADDLVLLAPDKASLHQLLADIREYMAVNLKLEIKDNYQIFPVEARGIDFVGYVHYHDCVYMRKTIKQGLARAVAANRRLSVASYYGWAKFSDSTKLLKKLGMTKFSELNIAPPALAFEGKKIDIYKVLHKEIKVLKYEVRQSKYQDKGFTTCLYLQVELDGEKRVIFKGSNSLEDMIKQVPPEAFPLDTMIVKDNDRFIFV